MQIRHGSEPLWKPSVTPKVGDDLGVFVLNLQAVYKRINLKKMVTFEKPA